MNTRTFVKNNNLAKPWIYFLVTCVWSWAFFGIAYWLGLSGETGGIAGAALVLLALSGPSGVAIIFVYLTLNEEGRKDYWKKIVNYRTISIKWHLIIIFLVPTLSVLAAALSGYWHSSSFFTNKLSSICLLIVVVPLVPLLEELGWRGYAIDRLQEKYNAVTSSLILGVVWGFWHLPAFFLPGSSLGVMPFASLAFWLYMINLIELSVCFTWIYNNTGRSVLATILFHMLLEISSNNGLIPFDRAEHCYNVALWTIVVVGIIALYGTKTLVRKNKNDANDAMFQVSPG